MPNTYRAVVCRYLRTPRGKNTATNARDQAIDTTVYDMKLYTVPEIRFGMRYAESVTMDEHGHATADLSQLSVLEPDEVAQPEWAQWLR